MRIKNIIDNVDTTRRRSVYKLSVFLSELKEQRNQVSIVPKFAEKNFNNIKGPVEKVELRKKEKVRRGALRIARDVDGWKSRRSLRYISKGGQCAGSSSHVYHRPSQRGMALDH